MRILTREEALRHGAKPTEEEERREESRGLLSSLFKAPREEREWEAGEEKARGFVRSVSVAAPIRKGVSGAVGFLGKRLKKGKVRRVSKKRLKRERKEFKRRVEVNPRNHLRQDVAGVKGFLTWKEVKEQ